MQSEDHQLHVIFFPLMAHGHVIPIIDIARLFSLRGVKSTIVTTPILASHISTKINRYQNSGLDISIITIPFPTEQAGLPKDCESSDSITTQAMGSKFFKAVPLLQPQLERLLEETHPDCIVSDMFIPWTTDVAEKFGIPRIVFHGTSFFALSVSDSINRYSLYESDAETLEVPGLPDQIKMKSSTLGLFGKVIDICKDAEVRSYGVLVNSFYDLEPAYVEHYRTVIGRRIWHVGPVSLSNKTIADMGQRGKKATIDEHTCLKWLDSKENDSVIYVSFGSVSRFSCVQVIEIAKGLEASGVSFVWVVRTLKEEEVDCFPDGFEERMEGKGLVIRDWAPQVLILDHPAIGGFMTHCGWNSTLEGISTGVPMITWPLFAEQFQNEIFITEVLKIGIKVGTEKWNSWADPINGSVSQEIVKEMVSRLMRSEEGKEMRKRARGLKELAKRAVEEGGSSHAGLTDLINELQQQRNGVKAYK